VGLYRAPGAAYARAVRWLDEAGVPWEDAARGWGPLERAWLGSADALRDYQREAVAAWRDADRRGIIVLPTGAGKSVVAEAAIADAGVSALVVAPTLDLVAQWYDRLERAFGGPVGVVGGGANAIHDLTVTTFDSAHLQAERLAARFGLVVYDEVHHLPSPSYGVSATASLAPFRLGLTATLERPDGAHERLGELVGPVVFRQEIPELAGEWLAEYRTEMVRVGLTPEERASYDAARDEFRGFIESRGLRAATWNHVLRTSQQSPAGRSAMAAWRRSRRILEGNAGKLAAVDVLLRRNAGRRTLVFTNDNPTAFEVSRRFLVPALTHHTDAAERRRWLAAFSAGEVPVLVTSRVLNEGVDVPLAEVAIVMSGSGTVREHVQRLGRILRRSRDKQAVLYELVVADTAEERTSARRREHDAYRRS
jgi:superfamily II DNA or RNA helicase